MRRGLISDVHGCAVREDTRMETSTDLLYVIERQSRIIAGLLEHASDDLDTIGELAERVSTLEERLAAHMLRDIRLRDASA